MPKEIKEKIIEILEKGIIPTDDLRGYIVNRKKIADQILELFAKEKSKEKEKPMGVSQWKEYGKKYGYWNYFVKETLKEVLPEKSGFVDDWGNAFNYCRYQIIKTAKEKWGIEIKAN